MECQFLICWSYRNTISICLQISGSELRIMKLFRQKTNSIIVNSNLGTDVIETDYPSRAYDFLSCFFVVEVIYA